MKFVTIQEHAGVGVLRGFVKCVGVFTCVGVGCSTTTQHTLTFLAGLRGSWTLPNVHSDEEVEELLAESGGRCEDQRRDLRMEPGTGTKGMGLGGVQRRELKGS